MNDLMTLDNPTQLALQTDLADVQEGAGSSPYAFFAHSRNKQISKIVSALGRMPKDGDPILYDGSTFHALNPMKLIVCTNYLSQYWAQVDSNNAVQSASLQSQRERPWAEYFDIIGLVFYNDTLTPARVTFRGPKCPAMRNAASAIREAGEPAWANRSKLHGQAYESVKQAFARVVHTVTVTHVPAKSPGGFDYQQADVTSLPINSGEYQTVADAWKTDAFRAAFSDCISDLNKRLTVVKSKLV